VPDRDDIAALGHKRVRDGLVLAPLGTDPTEYACLTASGPLYVPAWIRPSDPLDAGAQPEHHSGEVATGRGRVLRLDHLRRVTISILLPGRRPG
jgi:hypothetical protein